LHIFSVGAVAAFVDLDFQNPSGKFLKIFCLSRNYTSWFDM